MWGFGLSFDEYLLLAESVLLMLSTGNQYIYTKCTVFSIPDNPKIILQSQTSSQVVADLLVAPPQPSQFGSRAYRGDLVV